MRWEAGRAAEAIDPPYIRPAFLQAVGRGVRNRCPVCGEGKVFDGFLTLVKECPNCEAPIGALRADDAPPYFTILLVGHLLVPGVLLIERLYEPPMWLHMAVWLPLFTIVCTLMLRPVKGAVVGWMMSLGMTGTETGPQPIPAVLPVRPVRRDG